MPKSRSHLIRSQPAGQPAQETAATTSSSTATTSNAIVKASNEDQVELQHTLDQLISQVSIPQIRSSAVNKKQDGGKQSKQRSTIRKLGQLVPNQAIQPSLTTVSGHRLVGPRNSRPTSSDQSLVLTISRKTPFSVYLKRALAHLRKPAASPLILRAMGCAISMAFSLAMSVESNLLLASPAILLRALSTGTVVVGDEITPRSSNKPFPLFQISDPELIYQTRNQASIEITLSIKL